MSPILTSLLAGRFSTMEGNTNTQDHMCMDANKQMNLKRVKMKKNKRQNRRTEIKKKKGNFSTNTQ